ncbi:MAG: winged helix-turn-helix transcriptional regulator [Ignavibacteriales bacterium]|nr:winged helix-turn-helix transcriptional regulator [Ignavibacteriales bacterium]
MKTTSSAKHDHQAHIRSALKNLANDEKIIDLSETFKVLSDPTRLKIVMALSKDELCTFDIAKVLGVSESAVSHQLRLLKTLRLVKQRKNGKMVFYSLDDEHIEDLIRVASRHISEY